VKVAALFLGLLASAVAAQEYPGKPVRLLIGFPTGGNVDVVGRIVAQKMSEGFGQQVLPENRTGAGSIIANEHVAKSAADGYTLLVVSGAFVTQAATMKKLPYDPVRDFSFISTLVTYPLVFSVRSDSRFRTLDEFIGFVKSNPGKVNYPSPGMGTLYHLAGELFVSMAGIDMQHVPFRGGSEPLTEVRTSRAESFGRSRLRPSCARPRFRTCRPSRRACRATRRTPFPASPVRRACRARSSSGSTAR